MWMAYVEKIKVEDLKTAVESLRQTFSNLHFDAEHEAVYGMSNFFTEEYCMKLAKEYLEAMEVCNDYLENSIDIDELITRLIDLEMIGFLHDIKKYLPPHLSQKIPEQEESDTEDNIEEGNREESASV